MKALKIIKAILFGLIYSTNLFLAVSLWLCGESGNIMLGINLSYYTVRAYGLLHYG